MISYIAIIPARYASTRFPGKPLADIGGKPMIRQVYERISSIFDDVVVATDDERIEKTVIAFGGKVVMTSPDHKSGTDRCAEALAYWEKKTRKRFDVIINIQGDEPFIRTEQIDAIKSCFLDRDTEIATLIKPVENNSIIVDPNRPKVIIDKNGFAIYFSRSPVPYLRGIPQEEWADKHTFYQHIGLYAYRSEVMATITKLPQSSLEIAESLEQLRWIENGIKIKTAITPFESYGIDTPEDLKEVLRLGLL